MHGIDRRLAAKEIMEEFARATGLSPGRPPRRYLWTDAFAVCNYLALHRSLGDVHFLQLALDLVDQVHHVLGRHRDDDSRSGWISGLSEEEGARRPTAGGLRIGKSLSERSPEETYDQRKEWDRDGQYYHYLTKWIHALTQLWRATREPEFHRWAVDLASAMHRGFLVSVGGRMHIYWKMSIDLSRPLVPSSGHHDPLDGFLTLGALEAAAPSLGGPGLPELDREIHELAEMCRGRSWATDDPLGIGGLLVHLYQCFELMNGGRTGLEDLFAQLLGDTERSLMAQDDFGFLRWPPEHRLGFRELGMSIGFAAADQMQQEVRTASSAGDFSPESSTLMSSLTRYRFVKDEIDQFWLDPRHRETETWTAHSDISEVMLATALMPEGFLGSPR